MSSIEEIKQRLEASIKVCKRGQNTLTSKNRSLREVSDEEKHNVLFPRKVEIKQQKADANNNPPSQYQEVLISNQLKICGPLWKLQCTNIIRLTCKNNTWKDCDAVYASLFHNAMIENETLKGFTQIVIVYSCWSKPITYLVPLNTKDDLLKNDGNQTVFLTTDLHSMDEMGEQIMTEFHFE